MAPGTDDSRRHLGASPAEPADEEPQTVEGAVGGSADPDSPGAALAEEDNGVRPREVPEPNEPG